MPQPSSVWRGRGHARTYYIRVDGGDAKQCDGRADAPYPGSGADRACAWKHPFIALPPHGPPRMTAGDTLLIGSGDYLMGMGAPGAGSCSGAGCHMPPIPSGTDRTRTRILGRDCSAPPRLVGVGGARLVIDLDGSSNIEVGCLEITDQDDCVHKHSRPDAACTRSGNWARVGLYARASHNVWLHDLNIHGMAHSGMNAGGLGNWTMERVKLNRNGRAGWDGNIGTGSSNSGKITIHGIEIAWNGCGERVSTGEPWACWAQKTGGYGDGVGTPTTGGQWLIEDAFIHHNTSDGLDLRYMDGADTTKVTLRRIHSVANAGNQVKVKGNSLIENSVLVGHCTFFKGKYYMLDGDNCRAYGSSLLLVMTGNDTAVVRHNTIAGEGDAQIAYVEGNTSDKVYIQNNTVVGFPYFRDTSTFTMFSGGSATAARSFSGNLGWNVRSCPSGTTCGQNPKLTNMTLAGFDAEPLAGSPVIDKAPMISAVTNDFVLQPRPSGVANDIGAYEVKQGTLNPSPTPTCTRAAPTMTLSGPTNAVAAGTRNTYTLALRNNDSSACSNTAFALARTVPSGWTGTLSATSVTLAPGASGSATLAVTSTTTAAAGTYSIGAGSSSSVSSIHTAKASSTYAVAAPIATCTRNPATISISGPTSAVAAGSTVKYTVSVRNNDGSCYNGKTFNLASSIPSGWTGTFAQSSSYITPGSTFSTTLSVKSASSAAAGTYQIGVGTSTTYAIHTASAATAYTVAAPIATCTRNPATISISGPTSAVAAGSTVKYTVSVRNNDGSCYNGKTFNLASSVPSGWTGAFAQSSSYITPGSTFSTTLSVKSASSAAAGTYAIRARTSTTYAIHSAETSTAYAVAP